MDISHIRFCLLRLLFFRILPIFVLLLSCSDGQLFRKPVRSRDLPQTPPAAPPETQAAANAPQPGMCPCVRPSPASPCIAYNERYQAATLEEVVVNFADLTDPDPSTALNVFNQKPYLESSQNSGKSNSFQCKSLDCVACYHALSERLIQQFGSADSVSLGIVPLPIFAPQIVGNSANNAALSQRCPRLQQQPQRAHSTSKPNASRKPNARPATGPGSSGGGVVPATNGANGGGNAASGQAPAAAAAVAGAFPAIASIPDDAAWLIMGELDRPTTHKPVTSVLTSTTNSTSNTGSTTTGYFNGTGSTTRSVSSTSSPKRNKREAAANSPPGSTSSGSLGVTTPLDCSYKKGSLLDDNSGYVGLCNLCWSLRTLSPKYFPRYINELSCDQSDNGCLKGQGKCRERYRSVDVLYNYGTDAVPKWQQYSINSPVACECQVMSGTTLHDLISK